MEQNCALFVRVFLVVDISCYLASQQEKLSFLVESDLACVQLHQLTVQMRLRIEEDFETGYAALGHLAPQIL